MPSTPDRSQPIAIEALQSDLRRLEQVGYYQVMSTPSEPGQYHIDSQDGAPGWGEWYYWLTIYELPDQPLNKLGWNLH